jgi:DNA-directed RNA polymerase specialized sigma24 family protein
MAEFQTTQWSLVARAGGNGSEEARQAVGELLGRYLPALRAHLLHQRVISESRIDDLLQGFVSDKILQTDLIAKADRSRGKFRTLLLTALSRYVVDQWRGESAQKRRVDRGISLDADEHGAFAHTDTTPSAAFDTEWARQVLRRTLDLMQSQCRETGREDVWGVFQARLVGPLLFGEEPMPYEQLVERFQLATPRQAANVLITGKRLFNRTLRQIVGEYTPQDEIDAEIRQLTHDLGHASG